MLLLLGSCWGQEFPGGPIQVRETLTSERGSHPRVVVQTVPGATTTATCLALRYAQPGTKSPPPWNAHLLEHLLYRSAPGKRPGSLLLRNEIQGDRSRAWVTAQEMVLSEEVPSEEGLESLKLQLARLTGVPQDTEGLKLEKQALRSEIRQARRAEEQGRRKILAGLGHSPQLEGTWSTIKSLQLNDLKTVLNDCRLNDEVVISVIGPHTTREVRQVLSQSLQPLATKRQEERKKESQVQTKVESLEVESPEGYSQLTTFFQPGEDQMQTLILANKLLSLTLKQGKAEVGRESSDLYRLDLNPPTLSLAEVLDDLTPEEADRLFESYRSDWLQRYESQQERAEMLALTSLRGQKFDNLLDREQFSGAVERAKKLLTRAQQPVAQLTLKPAEKTATKTTLFPFRTVARREPSLPLRAESLPNGLSVTSQQRDNWPTVAISGFFRVSPPLTSLQRRGVEEYLQRRSDLKLSYEVKPGGIFFHAWRPSEQLEELLKTSASELKQLSEVKDISTQEKIPSPGLVEGFFMRPDSSSGSARIRGKNLFAPKDAHLVVVGQFDPEALDKGLRPAWSGWFGSAGAKPVFPTKGSESAATEKAGNQTVDLPAGSQAILMLGLEGPARSSPDFLAFNLALQTLAGRPATSLLARELHGGQTSVNSVRLIPLSSTAKNSRQVWVIALRLNSVLSDPKPLVDKVERLLKGLALRPLASSELKRTRDYLKSSLTLSAADNPGRARVLAHSEFYRLSRSYSEDFAGLYDNLKPELVRAVCAPYLKEAGFRWLYLKPRKAASEEDKGKP